MAEKDPVKQKPSFNILDPATWGSLFESPKAALEIAAYILMVAGIVLLFSSPHVGGALVGFVFALYFAEELTQFIKQLSSAIEKEGMVKTLLLFGLGLTIFISLPSLFIGGALGIILKNSAKNL